MFVATGGGGQTPGALLCHSESHWCVSSSTRSIIHQSRDACGTTRPRSFSSSRFLLTFCVIKLLLFGGVREETVTFFCLCCFLSFLLLSAPLPHSLSLSPPSHPPLHLNPSASCRSVRLPVSVPIRFHLIHVTSINTQSSPDKSRPLSPPSAFSRVALHHCFFFFVLLIKLSLPQLLGYNV